MRGSRPAIALLTGAALLAPALARADYSSDYVAGLAALDRGDYAQAVQSLKKALDAQAEPVQRVMIQGNAQPYLPHHFLGLAQFKLGDCAAAQAEWNDPMNARMLGLLKQLRVKEALLRGQRQDLADERQLRAQEEQLLGQCTPAAASAAAKSTTQQSTQTTDTQPAAASVPASTTSAPPPKPAAVAAAGPPPALLRAFDDFVSGRYASVAKLDADALAGNHARFQAYLLRSAARFALTRSGDRGQLDAARRDAQAAQALDKSAPDERVFSPAFRTFYAEAQ
ncbi:MAG TPA: hypothetical protein VLK26_04940 [Rudaea sp.]|nr:hypothetical protein [Rudaea sp.]